jgi:pyridoxamine 5'-phosphate oxidase
VARRGGMLTAVTDAGDDELRVRLRALRVFDVELPAFDTDRTPEDPAELFRDWLLEAIEAEVREPHAMTLSTVDDDARPSSRVLILKGLADGRWQFATSRNSRKAHELASTPWAAANFYWSEIGRQVRLRGRVLEGTPAEAARDFLARGNDSRAESLVGNQSAVLIDRAGLDAALEEARVRVTADPQLVPEHWALYHLIPDEVEFWQADPARRHVRLRYALIDQRWRRELLWP